MLTRVAKQQGTPPSTLTAVSGLYTKYLGAFFEQCSHGQVHVQFIPYESNIAELRQIKKDVNACIYPALKVFHRLFFVKDFANLCSVAFQQKNATLFVRWLTNFMERIEARLHKKFLRFLGVFLRRIHESAAPSITQTGVKIIVKGKISVSGNAKKRTKHLAYGTRSLCRKSHSISFAQGLVRTPTGVLGFKCFIFY